MAGSGDGPQTPHRLEPIPLQTRGLSGRAALGLVVAVVLLLVGVGLAGQTGDRGPRPEAALVRPTVSPVATPSPTAPPAPPIGTPPPRVAISFGPVATCPPGSTPDEPGSADQARPPPDVPTAMAFNRRAGRLVALAEAADGVETWTFDVCTNTWMQMHPDREPPNAGELVYDANSDVTVGLIGSAEWPSAIWAYDLGTDTWTEKRGLAPTGARLRFYDPVSGLVVVTADDGDPDTPGPELWSYEVETDAWSSIRQANQLGSEPVALAYDTSVDRMVAYAVRDQSGEARTWLFDPRTGTWSGTRAETPELFVGGWFPQPAIAFDEEAGRTVVAGLLRAVAYDATVDRWETLLDPAVDAVSGACSTPECRSGHQMVYDAVNGRLAAYGGEVYTMCTWEAVDDMWALDMATRSWTLVLPPAPEPPPLRDLASEPPDSMGPDRSPWVRAAKATLHGGPFFTRVPGVADEPWSGTPPTEAASVADGLLVPECQGWTEGTVWWEETTSDPSSRAWVEIDLGGTFVLDAAVVQADVNDTYRLSYRDRQTSEWVPLWDVPFGEAGGMATRPEQGDASVRWPLPRPVVTDALRFEATAGDYQYSVSEIAVFGLPAP